MTAWQQWVQRPQNMWFRRALFQVHLWTGIGIGIYILLISVSGSAIVFRRQLENKIAKKVAPLNASGSRLSEDAMMQRGEQDYKGYKVTDVFASTRADRPSTLILVRGKKRIVRLYNPYTGSDLGDPESPAESFLGGLIDFHDNLLAGKYGRFANGIGSILVGLVAITGLVVWWPGKLNWQRGLTISWKSNFQLFNWTSHSAVGFWCSLFILMWAISGAYFAFPKPFDAVFGDGQFLVWLARVHFGRFARTGWMSWPLETVWTIVGLAPAALFVTGAIMWWNRVLRRKVPSIGFGSPVADVSIPPRRMAPQGTESAEPLIAAQSARAHSEK
jgi:uncharacterized iron-regulated membrane protein